MLGDAWQEATLGEARPLCVSVGVKGSIGKSLFPTPIPRAEMGQQKAQSTAPENPDPSGSQMLLTAGLRVKITEHRPDAPRLHNTLVPFKGEQRC